MIISQVITNPKSVSTPLIKTFHESMGLLGTSAKIGYSSLEGYIAGLVAIEASRNALKSNSAVNRAFFKKALSGLNIDLGGYKVNFSSGSQQGSHFAEVVAIAKTGRIVS